MAAETPDHALDSTLAAEAGLSRSGSSSRLNAQAPEFVPRAAAASPAPSPPAVVPIHVFHPVPPPPGAAFFPPPPQLAALKAFDYYGFVDHEVPPGPPPPEVDELSPPQNPVQRDGLSDDVVQKITKQVEYYFSDINLATTEHLMRFITKDPDGFVPITVIAAFKKIKALVQSNAMLADILRTSSKLVVSDDGKRVRRQQPITESDMEDLQARITVAENLPEDHSYQNLMKLFSAVGSVRTIRTCYPQAPNGTGPATNRSAKLDMRFANKLHAFVEYETAQDAEKAVSELNEENSWRYGLRLRLLNTCMTKQLAGWPRKSGNEGEGNEEEDVSTADFPNDKHNDDSHQGSEFLDENAGEEYFNDKDGSGRQRGRGRGRGGRGRGRGYYHNYHQNYQNNIRSGGHQTGAPPSSSQPGNPEQQPVKQAPPPGPRMPDGTRGFTMGRGKPQSIPTTAA